MVCVNNEGAAVAAARGVDPDQAPASWVAGGEVYGADPPCVRQVKIAESGKSWPSPAIDESHPPRDLASRCPGRRAAHTVLGAAVNRPARTVNTSISWARIPTPPPTVLGAVAHRNQNEIAYYRTSSLKPTPLRTPEQGCWMTLAHGQRWARAGRLASQRWSCNAGNVAPRGLCYRSSGTFPMINSVPKNQR
jgi:hypothetical protein